MNTTTLTAYPIADRLARFLTFTFVIGRRRITVEIPPYFVATLAFVALASFALGGSRASAEQRRQSEMLTVLKERNTQLERSLQEKEQEREQLLSLADERSEELWTEMKSRDQELSRLWSILEPVTRASERSQRAELSSRGASDGQASADVRARYSQMRTRLQEGRRELRDLSAATRVYQKTVLSQIVPSGAPCQGDMTSGFGYRLHPLYGVGKLHRGCDFTTPYGPLCQDGVRQIRYRV